MKKLKEFLIGDVVAIKVNHPLGLHWIRCKGEVGVVCCIESNPSGEVHYQVKQYGSPGSGFWFNGEELRSANNADLQRKLVSIIAPELLEQPALTTKCRLGSLPTIE